MRPASDPRREFLLSLLESGLAAVNGRSRMRAALAGRQDLDGAWILAVGKAAGAMTLGAIDALGSRVERALVVSREDHLEVALVRDPRVTCLAGGHPVADARSLAAGAAALRFAGEARAGLPLLMLVSGGASSLLEALPDGVSPGDLQRLSEWALSCGESIGRVNAVRRRLSRVKDGRLLARLAHCRVEGYYLSDVPGDDPAVIGSGLLARAQGGLDVAGLPGWLAALLARPGEEAGPVPEVPLRCVGCLDDALDAIESAASTAGVDVRRIAGRLEGPAAVAAQATLALLADGPPGLWLQGGETTVVLPPGPGRGGRNQHLALTAATLIAGRSDLLVMAVGTDGTDGNSGDAGALVDGGTLERGRDAGLDAVDCLARADSGTFLEASGDLVHIGPTGTNVCDVLVMLRCEEGHSPGGALSM
jgi:hydroxypyruvate reductase